MRSVAFFVVNLFIFVCVFDPADKLLHLKVPLFCLCWLLLLLYLSYSRDKQAIPVGLLLYVFTMIFIPFLSVTYYYITNGSDPYEGFALLKSYFFISFAVVLYCFRFDLMKSMSIILTMLSIVIISVSVTVWSSPSLFMSIYTFGMDTGMFGISDREYSDNVKLFSAYFVTSPMLVIPIPYYVYMAIKTNEKKIVRIYVALSIINIVAMFIAGTRNNIFFSILLPIIFLGIYSRRKVMVVSGIMVLIIALLPFYIDALMAMLSTNEVSNASKLDMVYDYIRVLSDPQNLFFGQGLGSYFHLNIRHADMYVTELSYLEVVRNFGLFFGFIIMWLIFYPVISELYIHKLSKLNPLVIAYFIYLIMNATNPHLFSSGGFLIMSAVLANMFVNRKKEMRI